jgi:hypothetical protein
MKKTSFFIGVGLVCISPTFSCIAQPFAATQAAGPVTTTNATLTGMVTPRGFSTLGWFEWGVDASYGQTTRPVDAGNGTNVVRITAPVEGLIPDSVYRCRLVASNSAGITYGCGRRFTTGRRVASWGDPIQGFGGGPPGSVLPPVDLGQVVNIAAGDYHGLALKADGTVAAWGYATGRQVLVPSGLSNVIALAGGRDHSLAITSEGSVVAWGYNGSGQTNVPASATNVVAISAGDAHSLALKSDGRLASWGDLGGSIPFGLVNAVAISSGDTHWLALRNNGTVVGSSSWPIPPGLGGVVAIAAGFQHDLALKTNGTVVGWGNVFGNDPGAIVPAGLSNVVAIAAGDYDSLALKSDGTVVAWGTANGSAISLPVGLADVMSITCGDEFCMALASNTPPQPISRTLTGPVNQDSILSLANLARDPNGDLLSLRLLSMPASGVIHQFLSSGRGAAITETNTPVNDASNRVIFAPGLNEFGAPYTSFSVVANDGEFDSAPSLATVNIVPAPVLSIVGPEQSSNRAVLNFTGLSNAAYSVLASTDLTNWTRIGPASQPSPGQFLYSDTSVTNLPQRFFRIRSP